MIVKVQLPLATNLSTPLALVYGKGRTNMTQQSLNAATLKLMAGEPKAFFEAKWSDGRWLIGDRVDRQNW
jgi:hypothetical protein